MRQRLRSHPTHGKRCRRLSQRFSVVLALATAGALAVAGMALAAGDSTVTMDFSPSALPPPGTGYTAGKLTIHTHTSYTYPGGGNPSGATARIQVYLDDGFRFNTNAVPKCARSSIAGKNMQDAMAACGSSLVGSGTVKAIVPDNPSFAGDTSYFVNGCLRVFNGQASTGEVLLYVRTQISNPSTISCSTNGTQGTFTNVLDGDLTANPGSAGADYADPDNCSPPLRLGCQLDVPIPSNTLPVAAVNMSIQQGSFVAARCDDTPQQLNLRAIFTYNDANTQTVSTSKACT
jgi:hypothetical protein